MSRYLATAFALALGVVSLLPSLASARLAGNHNQTLLRE